AFVLQSDAETPMQGRAQRIYVDALAIHADRLTQLAARNKRSTEIQIDLSQIGLNRERPPVFRNGAGCVVERFVGNPQVEMHAGVFRVKPGRQFQNRSSRLRIARLAVRNSQEGQRPQQMGINLKRFKKFACGLPMLALRSKVHGFVESRFGLFPEITRQPLQDKIPPAGRDHRGNLTGQKRKSGLRPVWIELRGSQIAKNPPLVEEVLSMELDRASSKKE